MEEADPTAIVKGRAGGSALGAMNGGGEEREVGEQQSNV